MLEFQQTTVISGMISESTGGVTEAVKEKNRYAAFPLISSNRSCIGHELVHAFQYDLAGQGHSDEARYTGADLRIPLFLVERSGRVFVDWSV